VEHRQHSATGWSLQIGEAKSSLLGAESPGSQAVKGSALGLLFRYSLAHLPVVPRFAACAVAVASNYGRRARSSFLVCALWRAAFMPHRDCPSVSRRNGEAGLPHMRKALRRPDAAEARHTGLGPRTPQIIDGRASDQNNSADPSVSEYCRANFRNASCTSTPAYSESLRAILARAARIPLFTSFPRAVAARQAFRENRSTARARPSRVVEVLVLFLLHLLVRGLQRFLALAVGILGQLMNQLPIQMILRLGEADALARHDLRRFGSPSSRAIRMASTSASPMCPTTSRPGVSLAGRGPIRSSPRGSGRFAGGDIGHGATR
jgi:hypothetical protein